jgi:GNAT superfamily N-acetyltransferase
MDQILITPLTENDIDVLIPLAHAIWHAHYPGIITTGQIDYMLERGYTRKVILDEMTHQGVIWLALRDNSSMIGFASLGPHGENVMKLHKLYLLPGYHGRGIGSQALAEIEGIAKQHNSVTLVLNVNRHNQKAIQAYTKAGWHVAEEVRIDIGGGYIMDDYVMAKQLI